MCYQRCETTADGCGVQAKCTGHCGAMERKEKSKEEKGEEVNEGPRIGHMSPLFLSR